MNCIKACINTLLFVPEVRKFDSDQLYEIYSGFRKYNLSVKQVGVYAKLELHSDLMCAIKRGLAKGVSCRDMEICINMQHSVWRINTVVAGIQEGLSPEDILRYSNPNITDERAFVLYSAARDRMLKNKP